MGECANSMFVWAQRVMFFAVLKSVPVFSCVLCVKVITIGVPVSIAIFISV